jgi:hypothetical protein
MRYGYPLALAALLVALPPSARALPSDTTRAVPPGELRAVRTATAPAVDGRLDDVAWAAAPPIEGFRQRQPTEGAEPTQRTVVRILYDDGALYVGARLYDTAPDSIVARLSRRDEGTLSDAFMVMLDPYHDRRSGYYFGVNAAGTLMDGVLYNDTWDDDSWDGVWQARVARDAEGWTAEFRLPYSQLRFPRADVQVWGVNLRRDVARNQERDYLHVVPSTENGFVSHFPDLVGIERIRPGRGVELVPYVTSRAALTNPPDGDPFDDGASLRADAGADLRLGLTSNLTLNATINPDFGQVEVDPAVVNLSAFETFFPERRPFFVEGLSVFDFGSGGSGRNMGFNWVNIDPFYTRRIGRAPAGELRDHEHADVPSSARILGAAKVTGRMGATNVGAMGALTGRTEARLAFADGTTSEMEVEPLAGYGVVRAQREFNDGAQGLGLMGTAVRRDVTDDFQREYFNDGAYVGGLDGWTRFGGGRWVLKGWVSGSHVTGTTDRMARLQGASTHYLQRPDRRSYRIDSTRTSLSGFAGRLALDKVRGNWIVNAALGAVSPTYDLNDVGFLGRTDLVNAHLFVGHFTTDPGPVFRSRTLMAAVFGVTNFDGVRTGGGLWTRAETQLLNYWRVNSGVFVGAGAYNQTLTRGGPLVWYPAGAEADVFVESDQRRAWRVGVGSYGSVGAGDRGIGGDLEVTYQPRPNVTVSLGPGYSHLLTEAQYVHTETDALASATYGQRYVFARLDQWQLQANLRLNWTFSPSMSLQLFAQPLVATGAYDGYGELAAPRTFSFTAYPDVARADDELTVDPDGDGPAAAFTFDRPDFRFVSLRGNAVFRWEYRPGSTLYLVWTQQREDSEADGAFALGPARRLLFDARPDNVVALKLTYWLGR